MAAKKYLPLYKEPSETFHRMINLEKLRLGWTQKQIKEFALLAIGKGNPEQFRPRDWINLCYKLRQIG
jgi:hypothetical protein